MDGLISRRLRHRVHVLGDLLGQTMTAQLGDEFLQKVEEVRLLAKTRRQQDSGDHEELRKVLSSLDEEHLVSVARAFNQFLNLMNIAEQADTTIAASEQFPDSSHLDTTFKRLITSGVKPEVIARTVKELHCDLVLTAHPTEITRRTLIHKYNRIADALDRVIEDQPLRSGEQLELQRLVAEVWHTDEINTERPTPQEEAKWGYAVIEHSFWITIPRFWQGLDELMRRHTGQSLPLNTAPITISTWMGGDRDGNAAVTTAVTAEVLRLARWMAADLYLRDIEVLSSQLSMSQCNDEVRGMCAESANEPYRMIMRGLRTRLAETRDWADTQDPPRQGLILKTDDLRVPLLACYQSLHDCGMGIIADGLLKETLIRLATFGVTLVNLDIKQSADEHVALMDELTTFLGLGSYRSWSEKARHDFLLGELASKRPLIPESWEPEGSAGETLRTIRLIADNNADGIACYIVSRGKNPSDILSVVLLLRKSGLLRSLPIVPLFETLEDLNSGAWTLERLLRTRGYRDYIDGHQQIMIGYSDCAKDAGQMAAAWAQYRSQEELVVVAEKYEVVLTLFHGRGGAAGRGGEPIRQAILSQPPNTVKGGMRVTEQGEMIRFKYGSPQLAQNSMDLVLSAAIEANVLPPPEPLDNWRQLMDRLSGISAEGYRSTVQEDADFSAYFSGSTPEPELSLLALGSGPTRMQRGSAAIGDLGAIPWVFAWTQKRLMVPAWLGTDAALAQTLSGKDNHIIREMAASWPFFQTQLDMLEMVLAKADMEIAEHYDEALAPEHLLPLGEGLRTQLRRLIDSVNRIKNQSVLLEHAPAIRRTIDLRDTYTDPLHFLQIELISRYRQGDTDDRIKRALLITIAGIAASMRNTG